MSKLFLIFVMSSERGDGLSRTCIPCRESRLQPTPMFSRPDTIAPCRQQGNGQVWINLTLPISIADAQSYAFYFIPANLFFSFFSHENINLSFYSHSVSNEKLNFFFLSGQNRPHVTKNADLFFWRRVLSVSKL